MKKPVVRSKTKSELSLAMDHVEIVCHGVAIFAPYCLFTPGWLIGYDGIVAAGCRIAEQLPGVAPHTETIRTALARAGTPYSLTVMQSSIVVRGDKVRVEVPLFPQDAIPQVMPDAPRFELTEVVRNLLIDVSKITTTRQDRVIGASVLLRQNTCVATDGGTILEAWHGSNLPGVWLLPTEFVNALDKVKYAPTHIGWSDETLTVWFGPNCWLRTNCYQEAYPDTDVMFAKIISQCPNGDLRPVPEDMLLALETLKPFLADDTITLWAGGFNTQRDGLGASYSFPHHLPPDPRCLPYKALRLTAAHGKWLGFCRDGFYWYGDTIRGITAAEVS